MTATCFFTIGVCKEKLRCRFALAFAPKVKAKCIQKRVTTPLNRTFYLSNEPFLSSLSEVLFFLEPPPTPIRQRTIVCLIVIALCRARSFFSYIEDFSYLCLFVTPAIGRPIYL